MNDRSGKQYLNDKKMYQDIDDSIQECVNQIIELWYDFLTSQKSDNLVEDRDYHIHKRNLFEVVKRLDKRKAYYFVFHGIEKICEYKEIGIICYWINTLKPFMVTNSACNIYNAPNEMFCIYLIVCALAGIYAKQYPGKDFRLLDANTIQDYVYNLKYCDLNREGMIFFVETLAKSYGIGMETNSTIDKRG